MRLFALCLAVAWITPAAAAPLRCSVDAQGRLIIPKQAVRKLKLKRAANGMVCVEFPALPASAGPQGAHHGDQQPARPPRIWTALRHDGALVIGPLRVATVAGNVPGKAGTQYAGLVRDGCLVLRLAVSKTKP